MFMLKNSGHAHMVAAIVTFEVGAKLFWYMKVPTTAMLERS